MPLKPKYSPLLDRSDNGGDFLKLYRDSEGIFWLCASGLSRFYRLARTSRIWIKLTEKPTRTSVPLTRQEGCGARFGDWPYEIALHGRFSHFLSEAYDAGYRHVSIIRKVGR